MQRHEQIERLIREKLDAGDFLPGRMLPGRRELAKSFGTSTITVGRAIESLVREGILRSDDRRGTFVVDGPVALSRMRTELSIAVVATLFPPERDTGIGHNPWTRQVVAVLEEELAGAEHNTMFVNTLQPDGSIVTLDQAVQRAIDAGVDGILTLAFSNDVGETDASETLLAACGIPSVIVSGHGVHRAVPHVFPDGFDAGFQVGQHLLRQGCTRVRFIAPVRAWWMQQRHTGIAAAFAKAGLPSEAATVFPSEPAIEWDITMKLLYPGHDAALPAFRDLEPGCAIVGANDEIAEGAIMAGRSVGLEPGRDYLLVGFDDLPNSRSIDMTSMRIPWHHLGVEAAKILHTQLLTPGGCPQVRVRWKLIPRGSSRRLSRQSAG